MDLAPLCSEGLAEKLGAGLERWGRRLDLADAPHDATGLGGLLALAAQGLHHHRVVTAGLFQPPQPASSLRNRLFGQGDRLAAPHPAAGYGGRFTKQQ